MRLVPLFAAAVLVAAQPAVAQDGEALLRKHDCTYCHARDETRTGPSWIEVAQRYRDDPQAVAKVTAVVRKGAHGPGPWHMPPLPQVPEAEARRMAETILATGR